MWSFAIKKYLLKSITGFGGLGGGMRRGCVFLLFPFNEYKDKSGGNTTDRSKECYPGLKNMKLDITAM